jgi:hypothetical protein
VFVERRAGVRRRCCSTTFARFTTKCQAQGAGLRASQPQSQSQRRLSAQLTRSGNIVVKAFSAAPHGSRPGHMASFSALQYACGKLIPSPRTGLGFTTRASHNVRRILQPAITPLGHSHAA